MSGRRVTIGDLAKELGLSTSTVSRALSGSGYVSAGTRREIMAHAKRRGYVPDMHARSLRGGVSTEVGLVVSSLEDPFYAHVVTGFESVARARGYNVVLFLDQGMAEDELKLSRSLIAKGVSGVAITPVSKNAIEFLLEHTSNVVQIDRVVSKKVSTVCGDNVEGGRLATDFLLAGGHRNIAFLVDHTRWSTGRSRLLGYEQAHSEREASVDPGLIVELGDNRDDISASIKRFLSGFRESKVTAVLAANSVVGEVFYSQCLDSGISFPNDLSFIMYDDVPWTELVRPAVTVVSQQAAEMGRLAAETLLDAIENSSDTVVNRSVLIQPSIVKRQSAISLA